VETIGQSVRHARTTGPSRRTAPDTAVDELEQQDILLPEVHGARTPHFLQQIPDALEHLAVLVRQVVLVQRVAEHQFEARRGDRRVEADERAPIWKRHEDNTGPLFQGRGRIYEDDRAAPERNQFRRRVRPAGSLRLGQPDDRTAQVMVDLFERFDDGFRQSQRDSA